MRGFIKGLIITLVVLLVLGTGAGLFAGNYFFNLALNPYSDKSSVLNAPHNSLDTSGSQGYELGEREQWLKEQMVEDRTMQSYDDLKLHALEVQNSEETNRWAILCHGYTSKAEHMLGSAINFYQMGYNVLLPDARGHGDSEGDYIGMGWHDRLDVVDWIKLIVAEHPDAQIVLYGVSMGGATVMMTAGEDLPDNVKAIVEDCGYTSVWGEFSYQLKETFGFPAFPVMHFASAVTKMRAGYTLGEADAIEQIKKSKTPMFFIHGDSDTFVPSFMADEAYEAANVPKKKLIVEGAGHGQSSGILGEEYWNAVRDFLSEYVD